MTRVFHIANMNCQGCARKVADAIRTVAPDADPRIDLPRKTVEIEPDAAPEAAIADALRAAGFPPTALDAA